MTRLFLKLYLSVIAGVILASTLVVLYLNSIIFPSYNHQIYLLNEPILKSLTKEVKDLLPQENLKQIGSFQRIQFHQKLNNQKVIKKILHQTGWLISVIPNSYLPLSQLQKQKLNEGQSQYVNHLNHQRVYRKLNESLSLEILTYDYSIMVSKPLIGLLTLLEDDPNCTISGCQELTKHAYSSAEKVIISAEESKLTSLERARLDAFPLIQNSLFRWTKTILMVHPKQKGSIIKTTIRVFSLKVRHVFPFILILILSIVGIRFTLYPLKQKLSRFEEAAERFEHGDLTARVKLTGQGPIEYLADLFDRSLDQVNDSIESNETLLQAISHELRTPISRLYFYLDLLVEEGQQIKREKIGYDVSLTLDQMKTLTSKLLEFNRLTFQSPLSQETLLFSQVVEDVLHQYHTESLDDFPLISPDLLQYTNHDLDNQTLILGNRHLLMEAISHLIHNAYIYGQG